MNEEDRMISQGIRPYIRLDEYNGTCDICKMPVFYRNFICMIVGKPSPETLLVIPTIVLSCPHCHGTMTLFNITGTHLPNTNIDLGKPPTKKRMN